MKLRILKNKYRLLFTGIAVLAFSAALPSSAFAQSARSLINGGVDMYDKKQFAESEVNFKKGMEKLPESFNAYYNLGDAQYKQERYDEAIKSFQQSLSKTNDNALKSKVYHNIGNSLMKSQKLKESVDAYKNALKLNPKDADTKYNLSYALNLLKQQQNQQKNDKNNQQNQQNKDQQNQNKNDQNKNDQNKDQQNKDQNKQDQNKNQDNKDQQQNQQNQNQPERQDNTAQKQEKPKMSKEEAERILNAIKNNEQDLQRKLQKREGRAVKTDKDW